MAVFKLIQKYKISYEGPALGISYKGKVIGIKFVVRRKILLKAAYSQTASQKATRTSKA